MNSRAQIVATIGPASEKPRILKSLIQGQMDIARFNFEYFDLNKDWHRIERVRDCARECGREIPIIADLPGPRIQLPDGHTYDATRSRSLSKKEEETIRLCAGHSIEYLALSFVKDAKDIVRYRKAVERHNGTQKIIAKIERKASVDSIDSLIDAADAVMVARGDLGNEIPLEQIPFIQQMIVAKANAAHKPVIIATQMMFSMTEHPEPTRAEVTDVEEAIREGADAVMLSEETALGKYPTKAVNMMERIIVVAEERYTRRTLYPL